MLYIEDLEKKIPFHHQSEKLVKVFEIILNAKKKWILYDSLKNNYWIWFNDIYVIAEKNYIYLNHTVKKPL